jgi:LppP/LprE lipoprotein
MRRLAVVLVGLLLVSVQTTGRVAADGSWLDGPVANWNQPGMEIPPAPPMDVAVDPRCEALQRPPETDVDRALVSKGWTLFGSYQAGWGIVAAKALSGYDGMCRPMGFQEFVFVDGILAGTISPTLMSSRDDGVGRIEAIVGPDQITASYRRYKPEDPLCCPSGSAQVFFQIERGGVVPLLVPTTPVSQP